MIYPFLRRGKIGRKQEKERLLHGVALLNFGIVYRNRRPGIDSRQVPMYHYSTKYASALIIVAMADTGEPE